MTKLQVALNLIILLSLSACSAIKSQFPDKEKDYQLTTEIPELIVPEDLSNYDGQTTVSHNKPNIIDPVKEPVSEPEKESVENTANKPTVFVELVEFSGGATRIRIEDNLQRTWRIVGKALGRNAIEIINRNEYEGYYSVQYDPNFKKIDDDSIWDEISFIFGKDPVNEQEFKIRLAENGTLTEIIVLDKQDIPQSKGNGLKLLKQLLKTIDNDLNKLE